MKYGTVCSGIEAPSVAWDGLGWEPVWFCENHKKPSKVLAHHYPSVPNLGDMTKIYYNETFQTQPIDLLCGGTPCQDFSNAGLRAGLGGKRGTLTHEFIRILATKRPKWFIWENVPGVFSCNAGRDFAAILGGFTGWNITVLDNGWGNAGIIPGHPNAYSIAWRVLDAKYFGVPQQRRRVFVVGYSGDWHYPAKVLFEPGGVSGYSRKVPQTGQTVAALTAHGVGATGADDNAAMAGHIWPAKVTAPLLATYGEKQGLDNQHIFQGCSQFVMSTGQANAEILDGIAPTLNCNHEQPIIVDSLVRRITPIEAERLQGFPDNYTAMIADTHRYKALGNSMAVPVMRWIGERINNVL